MGKVASKASEPATEVGVKIRVIPNARRSEVVGEHGEAVKLKVASPAVEGKANEAVLALVAHRLGVGVRDVHVISGAKTRDKVVGVRGWGGAEIRRALLEGGGLQGLWEG
jgi:uncharacterized protein (TIGR00251 family)